MSLLQFLILSFSVAIGAGVVGAVLELILILPGTKYLVREDELNSLRALNELRELSGKKPSMAPLKAIAPGRGHVLWALVVVKDAIVFVGAGILMGYIVYRFLRSGERSTWLWYAFGLAFINPAGGKGVTHNLGYWALGIVAYVLTLALL